SPGTLKSLLSLLVNCPDAPSARLHPDENEFIARAHNSCRGSFSHGMRLGIDAFSYSQVSTVTEIHFNGVRGGALNRLPFQLYASIWISVLHFRTVRGR